MKTYEEFLLSKRQFGSDSGFEPLWMPDSMFDFQSHLVDWNLRKGRSATFANCGLGKTLMQLIWAHNVHLKTGKPVLLGTPPAVGPQTVRESHKFGIDAEHSKDGKFTSPIVVTNYQRLHYFNSDDFGSMACDESGILKNYDGKIKASALNSRRVTSSSHSATWPRR